MAHDCSDDPTKLLRCKACDFASHTLETCECWLCSMVQCERCVSPKSMVKVDSKWICTNCVRNLCACFNL